MFDHLEPFIPCGKDTEFDPKCGELNRCYALAHKPSYQHLADCATARIGRRVGFTDIDGALEVNGHILLIEHKGSGVSIPDGQRLALLEMTAANERITVLAHRPIAGLPGYTDNMLMHNGRHGCWQQWTHGQFWDWYTEWLDDAKMAAPQRGRVRA